MALKEPVPPLPDDVSQSMARVIMWLLEKDPSKRPADYQTVLSALDDDDSVGGDPDSTGALTQSRLAAALEDSQAMRDARTIARLRGGAATPPA